MDIKINANYAVVSKQCIKTYSKKPSFHPLYGDLYENVEIIIKDGLLMFTGDKVEYLLNLQLMHDKPLKLSDVKHAIRPNQTYKKKKHFFSNEEIEYVNKGYIEYEERTPCKKIMSNFILERND